MDNNERLRLAKAQRHAKDPKDYAGWEPRQPDAKPTKDYPDRPGDWMPVQPGSDRDRVSAPRQSIEPKRSYGYAPPRPFPPRTSQKPDPSLPLPAEDAGFS